MSNRSHQGLAYDNIQVGFYEPTPRMRAVLRSTLHAVGFRQFLDCHSVDDVVQRLCEDTVDLLIIDVDSDTNAICGVVREVREGQLGYDPFLAIMALTSNAIPAMINRVLGVGCDDLITRPLSPKVIADRTANLVHNRKPFVVTADYVGPDRGGQHQGDKALPECDVPNALRHKALGNDGSAAGPSALHHARSTIARHRIAQTAARISSDAIRLKLLASNGEDTESIPVETSQLETVLALIDVILRLVAEQNIGELEFLARSMSNLAQSIAGRPTLVLRQIALLHLHGEAIAATLDNREEAAALTASVLNHSKSRGAA